MIKQDILEIWEKVQDEYDGFKNLNIEREPFSLFWGNIEFVYESLEKIRNFLEDLLLGIGTFNLDYGLKEEKPHGVIIRYGNETLRFVFSTIQDKNEFIIKVKRKFSTAKIWDHL